MTDPVEKLYIKARTLFVGPILCLLALPVSMQSTAWDAGPVACTHTDTANCADSRGNTHLWIVNNAISLLSESSDAKATSIANQLEDQICRENLEQGLWEADCNVTISGCSSANEKYGDPPAFGAHFFNSNGRDYFGNTDGTAGNCVTYEIMGFCVQDSGNAHSNALAILKNLDSISTAEQCRAFGRALHYFTDTTMPFHASGLSGASIFVPPGLHEDWENFVGTQHSRFPATDSWSGSLQSIDELFVSTSSMSWSHLSSYFEAMHIHKEDLEHPFGVTWSKSRFAETLESLDETLQDAYQNTATFIYSASSN